MSAQVHLTAIVSERVKDLQLDRDGPTLKDGVYLGITLINTSERVIVLPSKLERPDVFQREDKIEILFGFRLIEKQEYQTKSGKHPLVVSRYTYLPVELRPGEAMSLDPGLHAIEARRSGPTENKAIIVTFDTTGPISKRYGFTELVVSAQAITIKQHHAISPDQREP